MVFQFGPFYLELSSLILALCLVTFLQIKSFVLVNASGGIALLVYLVIAVSHLKMRKNGESGTTKFESENVAFPYVTYVTIVAIIAVLVAMFAIDTLRSQALLTMFVTVLIILSYFIFNRNKNSTVLNPKSKNEESVRF